MNKGAGMYIEKATIRLVKMPLKNTFTTSFGTFKDKEFLLIELADRDGVSGWGECVAFAAPWYNEETVRTAEHVMVDFLLPLIAGKEIDHPSEVVAHFRPIRRNNMAKAALECAVWDLYAKKMGMPLSTALGGNKPSIDVGISIGIQESVDDLLKVIERSVEEGYKRIKIKIKPGWDVDVVREIRRRFPDTPLMVDANSAYRPGDVEHLRKLDDFSLMMIEQPLAHDDIIDHAALQKQLSTPICLDESIHSLTDAKKAIRLGSCGLINIKIGRVGGLTESKKIHDYCREHGIPVWCGGMLESGVGRAHNIALTTLPQFTLPGDTSGSARYWEEDIIEPAVIMRKGVIDVPNAPGIGYAVNQAVLKRFTVISQTVSLNREGR